MKCNSAIGPKRCESKYTLRIVSDNLPEQGAKTVQPTLEDVCIYYFGDM